MNGNTLVSMELPALHPSTGNDAVTTRADELLDQHRQSVWQRTDRFFAALMALQWGAGVVLALTVSPRAWAGAQSSLHVHVGVAFLLGGAISSVPIYLGLRHPGALMTRHAMAIGQMLTSALLIHLSGGRIETHFHIFGSLAFLSFYRSWPVLVTATFLVAVDHFLRGTFWPMSVFGVLTASPWRWIEHALWVIFEDACLIGYCLQTNREMQGIAQRQAELEASRRQLLEKDRLEREMEIAARIQTSILPQKLEVTGLDIAACMIPASEAGGDYYEVLPTADGCWIGIGDVTGHGLTAGLIMLMIQSAVSGLSKLAPNSSPRDLLQVLNRVLFENIRERLHQDDHATLSLLHYQQSGHLVFAGAHEDMIICRARDGQCELVATPGPWVGAMKSIDRFATDTTAHLEAGDVLVLYTDGLTEAMNAEDQMFGLDRLCAELTQVRHETVQTIRDRLLDAVTAWASRQDDDRTVVVLRQQSAIPIRSASPP